MNPPFPPSLAGFHLQQHTQDHTQQPPISEADFLARVSAFERNEEAEARRARETMRRMISDQTKPSKHDRACGSPKRRRDRSPPAGAAVGIFREFPYHFQGPVPTTTQSQPPPQPPVAGFNIYGRHLNTTASASVYPFFELSTGGPPPLQDPYHDALVLVSPPYHLAAPAPPPFTSHPARLSDPAPFPGSAVPTLRIMPQYYPNPHDLTRDTHDRDRGGGRRGRQSYSPDHQQRNQQETQDATNRYTRRGDNGVWSYSSPPLNPHGTATPAPPPRVSSHLAPPTSPGFHQSPSSSKNPTKQPTYTDTKKREPSFRIDYDLRTHPATLRVSPSSSSLLSKPACTPKEQVNIRLNAPRVASRA